MDPIVWEMLAPMIVAVVLILTVGGVLILRPLAKRVSELLELYAQEQRTGLQGEVGQMRELLERVDARLQLMEERQDFTERLLSEPRRGEGPARLEASDRREGAAGA